MAKWEPHTQFNKKKNRMITLSEEPHYVDDYKIMPQAKIIINNHTIIMTIS